MPIDPTPQTTPAKPEPQACGRYFFDCPSPSVTTSEGVRCKVCGVTVTASYFKGGDHG